MQINIVIRLEQESDYRLSEEITREAFWNQFQPGADEHFLLNQMRTHQDFIPELDFVIEYDSKVVGSIVYTRSHIQAEEGDKGLKNIVTFGPVCIHPDYQGLGLGRKLIQHSIDAAKKLGYTAIIIWGDPRLYHRFGFRCAEKWDIASHTGRYAVSLLALPLVDQCFHDIGTNLRLQESKVFSNRSPEELEIYDATFPAKEKGHSEMQEVFKILVSLTY